MPPPGSPQPKQDDIDALVAWIERSLDSSAAQQRTVGYVAAHRLNRAEYAKSVKALLGVEIDPAEYLPSDIEVDGFTNIASALSVSPAFIEQYLGAASAVAHLAVGEPIPKVASAYFPPPTADQTAYVDGMPLGTRGGTSFTHIFPADGEYRLTIKNLNVGLYPRSLETVHTLVVLVDREEQFRGNIGGRGGSRFHGSWRCAGTHCDHETIRGHPAAGQGWRARNRRDVHRTVARGERRTHFGFHADSKLQFFDCRPRSGGRWRYRCDRPLRVYRRVADGKPRARVHLRAGGRRPPARLRGAHCDQPHAAGLPAARRADRSRPAHAFLRAGSKRPWRL